MTRAALVLAIILAVLAPSTPAHANHGADYVDPPWRIAATSDFRVQFYFTPTITNPNVGDLIRKAASEWNALGTHFHFVEGARIGNYDFTKPCSFPQSRNGIFVWPYDPSVRKYAGLLGLTYQCPATNGAMWAANTTFNTNAHWYVGVGDAPRLDDDFWSIATHELGHMAGMMHIGAASDPICANTSAQQTMCPNYWVGTERVRTPAFHDTTAFDARY